MTNPDLQFDRAESAAPSPGATCVVCNQPILVQYYTANGKTVCAGCRGTVAGQLANATGNLPKGLLFGIGGGILGAAGYYGVAAIANMEIGLVAIAVGWLVGRAMQIGSGGSGSRLLQVAAAGVTYVALAVAYLAMSARAGTGWGLSVSDALAAASRDPSWVALPITDNLRTLPMGAIGLLIVFIGISQAWRMTGPVTVEFEGPFSINQPPPPTASAAPTQ